MKTTEETVRKMEMIKDKERLDQGHLRPKLEVPGLTWPGNEPGPPWWEVSTQEKSHQIAC